jgi:hypothetical protein
MKLPGDDRAARPLADLAEQRDGAGSVRLIGARARSGTFDGLSGKAILGSMD